MRVVFSYYRQEWGNLFKKIYNHEGTKVFIYEYGTTGSRTTLHSIFKYITLFICYLRVLRAFVVNPPNHHNLRPSCFQRMTSC
jgi:hypothetical protein